MKRVGAFCTVLFFATNAWADDDARELSKRGYELLLVSKCDEAIPLLKRSAELAPDARTLVNLGRCEEKTKHFRDAVSHYEAARELAREKLSAEMVTQLDGMVESAKRRVPHIRLVLAKAAPPSTIVKLGGVKLPRDQELALDPGEISFVVTAAGYEANTLTLTLAEGQTQTITVAPGAKTAPAGPPAFAPLSNKPNSSPLKTVGVITLIAGAGAVALGGVFGAIAMGKKSSAEDAGCKDRVCPDGNAANLREDAKSAGTVSTIFFVGGGVLAAGGVALFLVAPSASADRVGLTVSGRF